MQIPEENMEENYIIFPPRGRNRSKFLLHELERELERLYFENSEMRKKLHELGVKELNFEKKKAGALNFLFKKKETNYKSEMVRTLHFHDDIVWNLESCYNKKEDLFFLVSGSADGVCHVILEDPSFKKPVISYVGHRGTVNSVCYEGHSGVILSCSGDGSCHLWKPDFTPFSRHLFDENPFEEYVSRDLDFDRSLGSVDTLDQDLESAITNEDDDGMLMNEGLGGPKKDYETFQLKENLGVLLHNSVVEKGCWIGESKKILTISWDSKIRKFDVEKLHLEDSVDSLEFQRLGGLSYSGKGTGLVLTGGRSGVVRLWDARDFRRPRMEIKAHDKRMNCSQFLIQDSSSEQTCKYLLTGGEGGTCKVWDLNNLKSPIRSIHCKSEINDISVGGGKFCISLTKPVVSVHDGGRQLGKLLFKCKSSIAHNKMITSAVLSKACGSSLNLRNKYVFTSSIDQSIVQWKFRKTN